jgi:hypothetical protein
MTVAAAAASGGQRLYALRSQEAVVFFVSLIVFLVFSVTLEKFPTPGNLSVLVFNMSLLGIRAKAAPFASMLALIDSDDRGVD